MDGADHQEGAIRRSFADVDVNANGDEVGGIAGASLHMTLIDQSFSIGDVQGDDEAGGLVGRHSCHTDGVVAGTVRNSYATGDVTGHDRVGGLVGVQRLQDAIIKYSFATGSVSGQTNAGGF